MPLENQLHIDQLLSNVSIKYRNPNYIALELFPEVNVKKSSDLYRIYERNFRVPDSKRSPKAAAREWDFQVSTASYVLERNALKSYVADNDADNYDLSDLRVETTEELTDAILRRLEKDVALLITTTSWSLNLSLPAAGAWDATTTVDPVDHFDTATAQVLLNSGVKPNIVGMGLQAAQALKNNAQILDRVKYTSNEVSENILAKLIGAEKMVIATQAEDTAAEGVASSIAAMWGDAVFFGYRPSNPGLLKPSAGYTFRKSIPMVKRFRVEERESDAIEVNMEYQVKVVASLAGFIIKDVI
jgi:hypothetical protein